MSRPRRAPALPGRGRTRGGGGAMSGPPTTIDERAGAGRDARRRPARRVGGRAHGRTAPPLARDARRGGRHRRALRAARAPRTVGRAAGRREVQQAPRARVAVALVLVRDGPVRPRHLQPRAGRHADDVHDGRRRHAVRRRHRPADRAHQRLRGRADRRGHHAARRHRDVVPVAAAGAARRLGAGRQRDERRALDRHRVRAARRARRAQRHARAAQARTSWRRRRCAASGAATSCSARSCPNLWPPIIVEASHPHELRGAAVGLAERTSASAPSRRRRTGA